MALTGAEVANLAFVVLGAGLGIYTALHDEQEERRKGEPETEDWSDVGPQPWYRKWKRRTWLTVLALVFVIISTGVVTWMSSDERSTDEEAQRIAKVREDSLTAEIMAIEAERVAELRSMVGILGDTLRQVSAEERTRFLANLARQDTILNGLWMANETSVGASMMIDWMNRDRVSHMFSLADLAFETNYRYPRKDCLIDLHATLQNLGIDYHTFVTWDDGTHQYTLEKEELLSMRTEHRDLYESFLYHPAIMQITDKADSLHSYYLYFYGVHEKAIVSISSDTINVRCLTTGQFDVVHAYPDHQPSIYCMQNASIVVKLDSGKDILGPCPYFHDGSFSLHFENGWGIGFLNARPFDSGLPESDMMGGECLTIDGRMDILNYLTFFNKRPEGSQRTTD